MESQSSFNRPHWAAFVTAYEVKFHSKRHRANNYAGANVSNLDVTIRSLQRFAPQAKMIVFMHPREEPHIGKLLELFPVHAVLQYPVSEQAMRAALQA